MKKFLLCIVVVSAMATIGGYFSFNASKEKLSDIQLANIEALSQREIEYGDPCYKDWTYDAEKPDAVVCGSPCYFEHASINWLQSTSYCR